jgi:hypothetical protein
MEMDARTHTIQNAFRVLDRFYLFHPDYTVGFGIEPNPVAVVF